MKKALQNQSERIRLFYMKKRNIIAFLFAVMMMAVLTLTVNAAGSASLGGPSEVRAGDTITLTFSLSGDKVLGLTAELEYDASKLTLTGTKQLIASPWIVETSGKTVLAYDNNQTSPINSAKNVFSATFKVSSGLSEGEKITVKVKNITASAGTSDISYSDAVYSTSLLGKRSSDSSLSSLAVSGMELSPKFDPSTKNYSVPAVPFNVTKLSITAKASSNKASYKITANSLDVGQNKINITVTAENGTKTIYTISVVREQDPNYVASNDATLSSITVSKGTLSPAFSSEIESYIVFVPYEEDTITVSAKAADKNASAIDDIVQELIEGDNIFYITSTAEDGVTEKTYTVHVFRMPAFNGNVPIINHDGDNSDDTASDSESEVPNQTDESTASEPESTASPSDNQDNQSTINSRQIYITTAIAAAALLVGLLIGLLFKKGTQKQ